MRRPAPVEHDGLLRRRRSREHRLDDASRYARLVAERYGTDHHELPVGSDVREDLPRLVAAMGEPMGDSAAMNLLAIASVARQAVTVALTGDGGDECFGGYNYFLAYYYAGLLERVTSPGVRSMLARTATMLRTLPGVGRRAGTLLRIASLPVEQTFGRTSPVIDGSARSSLFADEMATALEAHDPVAQHLSRLGTGNGGLAVDRVMQAHAETILADEFLPKADLATMGASLEGRCPLLDLDVVELAMRIPAHLRFAGGEPKGLLRRLARRLLPVECVNRSKQGFATPLSGWLDDWPDLVGELVLGDHLAGRGWFHRDALEALVDGRLAGVNREKLLWTLCVLELWLRSVEEARA